MTMIAEAQITAACALCGATAKTKRAKDGASLNLPKRWRKIGADMWCPKCVAANYVPRSVRLRIVGLAEDETRDGKEFYGVLYAAARDVAGCANWLLQRCGERWVGATWSALFAKMTKDDQPQKTPRIHPRPASCREARGREKQAVRLARAGQGPPAGAGERAGSHGLFGEGSMMADLSKFWRNQRAILVAEYDQKAMMAREMIAENFPDEGDCEKLRRIINFFAKDERAAMSIMGVLGQVGLCSLAIEDCTPSEESTEESTEDALDPPTPWSERAKELAAAEGHYADYAAWREWLAARWAETTDGTDHLPILETLDTEGSAVAEMLYLICCDLWRAR